MLWVGLLKLPPLFCASACCHQSTFWAPCASQDNASPAANTAPTGLSGVSVALLDELVSPIIQNTPGAYCAVSPLIPAARAGIVDRYERIVASGSWAVVNDGYQRTSIPW